MYNLKYPRLFSPIKLGNVYYKNRIFAAPNGFHHLTSDRAPTPEGIAFFERKAIGGFAQVTIGECCVDSETGLAHPHQFRLDNPLAYSRFAAYTRAIERHGAVPSVELQHCGVFSHYIYEQGGKLMGPSEALIPDEHKINSDGGDVYRSEDGMRRIHEMSEEDIYHMIDMFAKAAAFSQRCGCGSVMIHGGHGWGVSQFISPRWNRRKDRWGGSIENRMRLPLGIAEEIRKRCGPGFVIEFRMSASEYLPDGYGLDTGIEVAKLLDGKVDLINVSCGDHEKPEANVHTHPPMFVPDGVNVHLAAEVKKYVSTPVSCVGGLCEPEMLEEIIATGKADVVQIGHQSLADPDMPLKARLGKEDEINLCLRCNMCNSYGLRYRQRACSINPELGFEFDLKNDAPPKILKRVLVVGGGIAGMQAALTCARRGHSVILCEKTDKLGGILRCEDKVPFKKRLSLYMDRQELLLVRAGAEIRKNVTVTPEYAKAAGPDAIIVALGARPVKPNIPGIDGENVMSAEYAYANPDKAGKNILILGGGLVGTELSIYLSGLGKAAKVIEMLPEMNSGGNQAQQSAVEVEMKSCGVTVDCNTRALEVTKKGVRAENPLGEIFYEADTVVCAAGMKPLFEEAAAFYDCAPEFFQIGDCVTAKNLQAANMAGFNAARTVGRI
ncbi:MAG: NAD(P)/FAD-dependent oxidoreductase [Oscillospiraceae bacterium]|nr:NAD(P)/FAD-dependent oxidoreductase [Oscillospiraceae bacterium]